MRHLLRRWLFPELLDLEERLAAIDINYLEAEVERQRREIAALVMLTSAIQRSGQIMDRIIRWCEKNQKGAKKLFP